MIALAGSLDWLVVDEDKLEELVEKQKSFVSHFDQLDDLVLVTLSPTAGIDEPFVLKVCREGSIWSPLLLLGQVKRSDGDLLDA